MATDLFRKARSTRVSTLPFEIEGSLSVTDDGNIRVHADKIKSAHIPVKGLLHLLGEDLSKLVNQNAGRGMQIVGDDIILTPRNADAASSPSGPCHARQH